MKTKKVLIQIQCVLVIVLVLAVSLCGCLRIGMRKRNITDRLTTAGAQVTIERSSPIIAGVEGARVEDILLATMPVSETVDGAETQVIETAYIFFAKNSTAASVVKEACKTYIAENPEDTVHWSVYDSNDVVVCGHRDIVKIVRQY